MSLSYKWPVVGHHKPLAELEEDLAQERLSHAYLLSGPVEVGKTLVARTFAQILQCANGFCRTCITCKQIENGQYIDLLEYVDDGESLKVETVRELLTHLSTTRSGRHKIIFIQNVERMVPEAANTLLKTLEEPVSGVIFLMTTTRAHEILDTIVSRTRTITFHALPEAVILDYLNTERPDLDASTREMMAAFAMGRMGRAMKFLEDLDTFRFYQDTYQKIRKLLERPSVMDRMLYMEDVAQNPKQLEIFFELFAHVVRGAIFEKLKGAQIPYRFEALFAILGHLNQARLEIDHNVNARQSLENLMLKI